MQALQSNIASGRRGLASPLNGPFEAAKRFLERHRDDAAVEDQSRSAAEFGSDGAETARAYSAEAAGRAHPDRTELGHADAGSTIGIDRRRDGRREGGIFHGHSIEAALDFELAMEEEAETAGFPAQAASRVFDRPASPVVSTCAPDPRVVRAAILRVARESQLGTRDGAASPLEPGRAGISPAAATLAQGADLPAAPLRRVQGERSDVSPALPGAGASADITVMNAPADSTTTAPPMTEQPVIGPRPPMAFDEVARQVWSAAFEDVPQVRQDEHVAAAETRKPQLVEEPAMSAEDHGDVGMLTAVGMSRDAGTINHVAEAPALAHDAGNLLSALKLYSELLSLSGVLEVRHRHYAEDLKLLAERSERLIERLLQLSEPARRASEENLTASEGRVQASQEAPGEEERQSAALLPESDVVSPMEVPPCIAEARPETPALMAVGPIQPVEDRSAEEHGLVQATSLVDLLTRWGSLLSMIAHGAIQVNFGAQAELPVPVGEQALERILMNLVRNAVKATSDRGDIRISVSRMEGRSPAPTNGGQGDAYARLVLRVDDSGCGMSEDQVRKIMGKSEGRQRLGPGDPELNDRISASTDGARREAVDLSDHGTWNDEVDATRQAAGHATRHGLGLQIVRELVASSGGELFIMSRPGVGTRIEIHWPTVAMAIAPQRIAPASATYFNQNAHHYVPQSARPSAGSFEAAQALASGGHGRADRSVAGDRAEGAIAC